MNMNAERGKATSLQPTAIKYLLPKRNKSEAAGTELAQETGKQRLAPSDTRL